MKHVLLPDNVNRPLPFYLAMEEWLARNCDDEFFFMWQVDPTVICGRNQIIDLEVDVEYCRANNINICRRKSGGGCVFADRKNIMFSYIAKAKTVTTQFAGYTSMIAAMLRELGIDASSTSRNDILIGDRKVSGNAFYHIPEVSRAIVHGTMLYDLDTDHINRAITPSKAKLQSKGVQSVASRITTIKSHSDISLDDFKSFAIKHLCGDFQMVLTPENVAEIEKLSEELISDKWVFRKTSGNALVRTARIDGVGEFRVEIDLKNTRIRNLNLTGDYFLLSDLDSALLDPLKGVEYSREAIESALETIDVSEIISGLETKELINLIV